MSIRVAAHQRRQRYHASLGTLFIVATLFIAHCHLSCYTFNAPLITEQLTPLWFMLLSRV